VFQVKTALLYDALNLFITAYAELEKRQELVVKSLNCHSNQISAHGYRLVDFIAAVKQSITRDEAVKLKTYDCSDTFRWNSVDNSAGLIFMRNQVEFVAAQRVERDAGGSHVWPHKFQFFGRAHLFQDANSRIKKSARDRRLGLHQARRHPFDDHVGRQRERTVSTAQRENLQSGVQVNRDFVRTASDPLLQDLPAVLVSKGWSRRERDERQQCLRGLRHGPDRRHLQAVRVQLRI
jgi:hypothetical protein